MDYKIKGSSILSKLAYVEEHFGANAKEPLTKLIQDNTELFPILTSAWYPFELFTKVLETIAENHFDGDLSRLTVVGAYSAEAALGSVYKSFVSNEFLDFLKQQARLHHRFYNLGRTELHVHEDGSGCELLHRDKPAYSEADLYVASGFYVKVGQMHGLKYVDCNFVIEPDGARFTIKW